MLAFLAAACSHAPPTRSPRSPDVASPTVTPRPSSSIESPTKPPDCALLPAPASSCLGASLAHRVCESFGPLVEPRIGEAWLACMQEPASGSSCDTKHLFDCGIRAVNQSRPSGEFQAFCADVAAECQDTAEQITAPLCEHLIAAWKPDHRRQIVDCLRNACESGAFGACLP